MLIILEGQKTEYKVQFTVNIEQCTVAYGLCIRINPRYALGFFCDTISPWEKTIYPILQNTYLLI